MSIPTSAIEYFDKAIYYPMLIVMINRDRAAIKTSELKFTRPYLKLLDQVEALILRDIKESKMYFNKSRMQLNKLENDGMFTEYEFVYGGYCERRRYLNYRLRNRTEELLELYMILTSNQEGNKEIR